MLDVASMNLNAVGLSLGTGHHRFRAQGSQVPALAGPATPVCMRGKGSGVFFWGGGLESQALTELQGIKDSRRTVRSPACPV